MDFPAGTDFFDFARHFLFICEASENQSEAALLRALDGLAYSYHFLPTGAPAMLKLEYMASEDPATRRATITQRFGDLGFYDTADTLQVGVEQALVGDAIDDIVDIGNELRQALWLLEVSGRESAAAFVHLFRYHWLTRHLRPLANHLEDRVTRV